MCNKNICIKIFIGNLVQQTLLKMYSLVSEGVYPKKRTQKMKRPAPIQLDMQC